MKMYQQYLTWCSQNKTKHESTDQFHPCSKTN